MSLKITTRLTLWYLLFFGSAVILIAVSRHLIFIWGEEERLDDRGKAYAEMLGVSDYLRKPFAMDVMLEAVETALSRRGSPADDSPKPKKLSRKKAD